MAIKVYILKKSIMKSSVDEYLEMKAEIKEKKRLEKQTNPEKTLEEKQRCRHWKLQAFPMRGISIWMISSSARWSRSRNVSAETFIFQNSVMYLEKRYGCTFLQTAGTS